jgi:prepilin-type N-terminal cleavage/methylation domain-containing protein
MHTQRKKALRPARGFTLIELMVSFSALLIVLLGFSRMLLSSHLASSTTHEATLAKEAARSMIEVLQGTTLADVYPTYNASGADDPGLPNSAPGSGFAVRGLEAPLDDADGLPGQILFPEQGGVLSEFVDKPQYGWSMDMDRDGDDSGTADVSGTYRRLPVVVRVEWRGSGGDGLVEFMTVLGGL